MWCKACRQDVPGLASFEEGGFRCVRCGASVGGHPALHTATLASNLLDHGIDLAPELPAKPKELVRPRPTDDWEAEDQLRTADRMLRQQRRDTVREAAGSEKIMRYDPPQLRLDPLVGLAPSPPPCPAPSGMSAVAVLLLAAGLMGAVCGGVLLGIGWRDERLDLWNLGMPIMLIGQGAMLCGLLLQLERLWRNNRDTVKKLDFVDEQLHDLQHQTHLLGTTQGASAKAFYSHLAEGANPHLLLADLKGQFDLLAARVHQRR